MSTAGDWKESLLPGWYILLYHDVSREEFPHTRHVSLTCPPDVFRDHVEACKSLGRMVSIDEGMDRFRRLAIDEPLFSFWFDDGLAGVRKYAAPILAQHKISGAISICSRFTARNEMFWRFKLSYLHAIGAGPRLRMMLATYGCRESSNLRTFTMDKFQAGVLEAINNLYDQLAPSYIQADAFRIFDTAEGLLELKKQGWVIANHSAAHYPVGESHVNRLLLEQFEECERFIRHLAGASSGYWVFPFDRNVDQAAVELLHERHPEQVPVFVRNAVNLRPAGGNNLLCRIGVDPTSRTRLVPSLLAAMNKEAAIAVGEPV